MRNAEFRPRIICAILDAEKLSEFSILCSVTKAVVCYLLNKRVATFTIVPYCQQIAEHSAPVIPQSIRGRIPHSVFRIPQSILTHCEINFAGIQNVEIRPAISTEPNTNHNRKAPFIVIQLNSTQLDVELS